MIWPSAVRGAIGANAVLVAVVLLGQPQLAPAAAFGGMTAVHARFEPFAVRGRMLAGIGAGMVLSVGAGAVASAAHWPIPAVVVLLAVVAALAKLLTDAVGSGPPGGLIFVFATGTVAMLPTNWSGVGAQLALAGTGAAAGWLVAMWGRLVDPLGPIRTAVARALDAVLAARASDDLHPALEAVDTAWRAIATLPADRDVSGLCDLLADAESALADPDRDVDALRDHARRLRSWAWTPAARRRRAALATAGTHRERRARILPAWGTLVRRAAHPGSPALTAAARVGLGVLVAGIVAAALDLGHAYWAMVAAAAVLQSTNVRHTVQRTVQRAVGTVVGGVLGAALLLADLPQPAMLGCIVLALLGAEYCVLRNYGIAIVFLTPLTLLLASLLVPADAGTLVADRVVDTVLGSLVGFVAALAVPGHRYVTAVRTAVASAEVANAELMARLASGRGIAAARAEARAALTTLRRARDVVHGELVSTALAERASDIERHGHHLLRRSA